MKLGVTGAEGLIGWHIRAYVRAHLPSVEVKLATRATFADDALLHAFVDGCDAIIHCAGVNRGTDEEVGAGNVKLAEQLAGACSKSPKSPHVVYLNSTHRDTDNIYGRSKRKAAEILANAGGQFTDLVLPHVFGEFGKPFYNSAVST